MCATITTGGSTASLSNAPRDADPCSGSISSSGTERNVRSCVRMKRPWKPVPSDQRPYQRSFNSVCLPGVLSNADDQPSIVAQGVVGRASHIARRFNNSNAAQPVHPYRFAPTRVDACQYDRGRVRLQHSCARHARIRSQTFTSVERRGRCAWARAYLPESESVPSRGERKKSRGWAAKSTWRTDPSTASMLPKSRRWCQLASYRASGLVLDCVA